MTFHNRIILSNRLFSPVRVSLTKGPKTISQMCEANDRVEFLIDYDQEALSLKVEDQSIEINRDVYEGKMKFHLGISRDQRLVLVQCQ